jgi:hypothetical protein
MNEAPVEDLTDSCQALLASLPFRPSASRSMVNRRSRMVSPSASRDLFVDEHCTSTGVIWVHDWIGVRDHYGIIWNKMQEAVFGMAEKKLERLVGASETHSTMVVSDIQQR